MKLKNSIYLLFFCLNFYKKAKLIVVNIMKKILLVFIVFMCVKSSLENTKLVFNEDNNLYQITFVNSLSTNNFLDFFNNSKVIWIKPRINILYKDKLVKYNKYYFKDISNEKNINNFKKEYINYLNKLGYKNEALNLNTSGIMIDKIKVYLDDDELNFINDNLVDIIVENIS